MSGTPQFAHRGCQNVAHTLSFRDSSWDGKSSSESHQVVGQVIYRVFIKNETPAARTDYLRCIRAMTLMHNGALEPCPDTSDLWMKQLGFQRRPLRDTTDDLNGTATDTLEPIAGDDSTRQPTHGQDRTEPAQAGPRRCRRAGHRPGRRRRSRRRRPQDGLGHRRRTGPGGGHPRRFGRGRSRLRRPDHLRARHRRARRRHRHLRRIADRRRARSAADPDHRRPDPRGLDHRHHRRRGARRARPEPGRLPALGRPVPRDLRSTAWRSPPRPSTAHRFPMAARPRPR